MNNYDVRRNGLAQNGDGTVKKSKAVSAIMIALSVVFLIASAVLIVMSFDLPKAEQTQSGGADAQAGTVDIITEVDNSVVCDSFDEAIVSVVLDSVDIKNAQILKNQTCVVESSEPEKLLSAYTEYLDSLSVQGLSYNLRQGDFDGDGETEYYLYIFFPLKEMFGAIGKSEQAELVAGVPMNQREGYSAIIYADTYKDTSVFSTYNAIEYAGKEDAQIKVEDGILTITNKDGLSPVYVICQPYYVFEDYSYEEEAFRAICESYKNYYIKSGYDKINYYCADVSDAPGEEVIFAFSNDDSVNAQVYAFINGKAHSVYFNHFEQHATYLVEKDSKTYILEYTQFLGDSYNNYTSQYRYNLFRLDSDYKKVIVENRSTNVEYNSVTAENEEFFAAFNEYIKNAVVISDPYELTGYRTLIGSKGMSTHESVSETQTDFQQGAYLYISNCSNSKQGIVNVPASSYLNFREGPSVSYPKILINSSDSKSFVRQLKGSSVTVLDTVNTSDDAENPIWLRIQISYGAQVLYGYSSQAWIDLPGIKHISVGESFSITAQTNEQKLSWSTNDSTVASIDASTGELTAIRSGLVLVTVTSESGLSDSCLIAVD